MPKLDLLKHLLQDLLCDAFALCETWLSPDIDLPINDFNIVRVDRADSYGGVLLGINKLHSFYRIDLPMVPGIEIVACQVYIRGKSFSIASVYIPPRTAVSRRALTDIFSAVPEPLLILGDFNSHGTEWGELYDDNRSTLIYDFCDNFKMTILNTGEITRIAKPPAKESRIDLSICSRSLSWDCCWEVIQDPYGSDHLPIKVSISHDSISTRAVDITYDLTKHIDWKKYASLVLTGMHMVEALPPLDEYSFLSRLIVDSALQAQTRPVASISARKRPPSLWWDKDCTAANNEKSAAFKQFRKHGSIDDFERYTGLEKKFKNLIKAKKRSYWRRFVEGLAPDTSLKTLWDTGKRMRNAAPPVNEDKEYSNKWFFRFARKVCPDSVPVQTSFRDPPSDKNEMDSPFSMVDFSFALLSCKNSAPGMDRIKFNLLKNLPDDAKRRVLNLFNQFLEHNIVPDEWRHVRVIAILKHDKPASDHNSYRPIAMLSCMRKLLEKMILIRLDSWVESNCLLSDTQFGFRRGKGTNDCLALPSTEIQQAFDQKQQMASVFLDIKGAFDSVCIDILSDKLHSSGLSPTINNFLCNLLSEKFMSFSHGNSRITRTSYMGLPQGSCLSPLLYNFYVRDIDDCLNEQCTLRQLADDGVVSVVGPRAPDLQGPLQDTLDNLSTWAMELGIEFSPEKTELVVFSRKRSPAQPKLQLMGKAITHSMSFKYLGVWFDSKCTWGKHIACLKQKCQKRINFLRTITGTWWGAHPQDLIMLYRTTILSVLEYGSFCFQSAAKTHILKLQRIQYRCLRIALGCMQSTHTMSLEVLAGVLPLSDSLSDRFAELAFRFLIRSEVMNPLVTENFEKLLELKAPTQFMCVYYQYMTLEVGPSTFTSNRAFFEELDSSSAHFDLTMKQEIHGIPDSHHSLIVPLIFALK